MTYYKWIRRAGDRLLPPHGGIGEWPPVGQWLDADGPVDPCAHGLHLCRVRDLGAWVLPDPELYEVEHEGPLVEAGDKIVVPRARLTRLVGVATRDILVEWSRGCVRSAIQYATRVLPLFESHYPDDARPRQAIEAAQALLDGSAADAAARAAADARAADAAADAAARAAYAADAAARAASDVDPYAVYATFSATHAAAARVADAADDERQRQGEDLLRLMDASARPIGGAQ